MEPTKKREEELIKKLAKFIVDNNIEFETEFLLEGIFPVSEVIGQVGYILLFPWITGFFGTNGYDLINLFGFNSKKNIDALLHQIKELREKTK